MRSRFISTVALLATSSCGARPPSAPAGAGKAEAPRSRTSFALPIVRPARFLPIVGANESRTVEQDADGSSRLIERGLRLVEHPDGRMERAPDLLPAEGEIAVVHLPERLGGGVLFSSKADGTTRLYRSSTWTSSLTPLVRLEFESTQIVAGFDRLYAESARTHAAVAIDPKTGAILPDGSLPAAAAYGGMAFSEGWVGAIETDVRGVLVTFDAGASFHPLRIPTTVPGVLFQNGKVVVSTPRGTYSLGATGELEREGGSESAVFGDLGRAADGLVVEDDETPMDEPLVPMGPSVLGARPLEVAVLRGYPDGAESAVVVASGTLARVSLRDGRILGALPRAAPPGARCTGIRLFSGIGFVCGEDRGPSRLFAFRPPLSLEPLLELPEPRTVIPGGSGALIIDGGCPGGAGSRPGTYCVVAEGFPWREIRVQGDLGAERVVALADARAVVLVPPRLGAPGALSVVGLDGRTETRALSLGKVPSEIAELLERGLWLRGQVELSPGTLSGWVVGGTSFVGVKIALDGTVTAGTVRTDAPRASLSGAVGVVTDEGGAGFETTDGGATWADIALPVRADVQVAATGPGGATDVPSDRERGCSLVGCGLGSWLRVGWGKAGNESDLARAPEPPRPKADPGWMVTWSFDCTATGEFEGPADVARSLPRPRPEGSRGSATASRPDAFSDLASSAWRTFLGAPGPERAPGDLGFDFGTEDSPQVQLRGYAWGSRGAAWDRTGSWLVRVADRFSVGRAVWSTAVSRSPWADAPSAAEAFGSEPTHRISNDWFAELDPIEHGGVLRVRTGNSTELSVIEAGHAVVVARNGDDLVLDRMAGAVKTLGKWFLGAIPGPRALELLTVDGGTLSVVASFPRHSDDPFARVVRTVKGDAVGIWVIARGLHGTRSSGDTWLIHPVDPKTGEAGEPLVVPREALRTAPRPCDPDESGWVLVQDVNPMMAKIQLSNVAEAPALTRLEARLVAGPRGLCLDGLAAQVEGGPPKNLRPSATDSRSRRGAPLALTDRATDRRWGFRCAP